MMNTQQRLERAEHRAYIREIAALDAWCAQLTDAERCDFVHYSVSGLIRAGMLPPLSDPGAHLFSLPQEERLIYLELISNEMPAEKRRALDDEFMCLWRAYTHANG